MIIDYSIYNNFKIKRTYPNEVIMKKLLIISFLFVGLTEKAINGIYTLSGDLIRVLHHPDIKEGIYSRAPTITGW